MRFRGDKNNWMPRSAEGVRSCCIKGSSSSGLDKQKRCSESKQISSPICVQENAMHVGQRSNRRVNQENANKSRKINVFDLNKFPEEWMNDNQEMFGTEQHYSTGEHMQVEDSNMSVRQEIASKNMETSDLSRSQETLMNDKQGHVEQTHYSASEQALIQLMTSNCDIDISLEELMMKIEQQKVRWHNVAFHLGWTAKKDDNNKNKERRLSEDEKNLKKHGLTPLLQPSRSKWSKSTAANSSNQNKEVALNLDQNLDGNLDLIQRPHAASTSKADNSLKSKPFTELFKRQLENTSVSPRDKRLKIGDDPSSRKAQHQCAKAVRPNIPSSEKERLKEKDKQ